MKVFLGEGVGSDHGLVFFMAPGWEIVDDTNLADALVIVDNNGDDLEPIRRCYRPHQILVVQEIFHMGEYMSYEFYCTIKDKFKPITNKVIIIHNNMSYRASPCIAYYDHLFDRQKLYCTDYDSGIQLDARVWTRCCTKEMYALHPINKRLGKKYLALMRVYHTDIINPPARMLIRLRIRALLNSDDTYMTDSHKTLFLPNDTNENVNIYVRHETGGNWYPVSNTMYDSSIVSVYSETLVEHSHLNLGDNKNLVSLVTEKTFDALIRGNFILPFAYPGLIKDLTDVYGFQFPNWIDYSYDSIYDDEARFIAYTESFKKLDQFTAEEMYTLCVRDLHILEHNRAIFFSRPYSFSELHSTVMSAIAANEAVNWDLRCLSV